MKKCLLPACAFLMSVGASAAPFETHLADVSGMAVKVRAADAGAWKIVATKAAPGEDVAVVEVRLEAAAPSVPPCVSVSCELPQRDSAYWWRASSPTCGMRPDWGCRAGSRLSEWMPVYAYFSETDENRLTVSTDEVRRRVVFHGGLREEGSVLPVRLEFFSVREQPIRSAVFRVRFDRRKAFYGDAIADAVRWIERTGGLKLADVPETAFDPLYSTWYCFHQNLHAADVEAECAAAAKLGMKTLIVDDGWQTDDANRGYAFCGDWQVSTNRFPDMAAHVKRVQALGIKYMVWYSVPFVGKKSVNYARFRGKYLSEIDSLGAAVLDPRFPEVREFLIGTYERALREWNLDGFKLDFIDSFGGPRESEAGGGRDIATVPDAVDRLMRDVYARLRAIKPDVLVEFRQSYVGPGIRQFGNMLRVCDCPGNYEANRVGIAQLRLTSGSAAVHSDMISWHPSERTEDAARYVLNCLFGTIQYSMMLRTLPADHRRMIAHWLAFTQRHRETLLKGAFRPRHPQLGCPLIEAEGASERIVGVYAPDTVVRIPADSKATFVVNATPRAELVLDLAADGCRISAFDTFGKVVATMTLAHGLQRVACPESGYLQIENVQGGKTR